MDGCEEQHQTMQILIAKRARIWFFFESCKKNNLSATRARANAIKNYRFRAIFLSAQKWHPGSPIPKRYGDQMCFILDAVPPLVARTARMRAYGPLAFRRLGRLPAVPPQKHCVVVVLFFECRWIVLSNCLVSVSEFFVYSFSSDRDWLSFHFKRFLRLLIKMKQVM